MQTSYRSLYGQMLFTTINGLVLIFFPNLLLSLFGIESTDEPWIRILGLLVLALTIIYYHIRMVGDAQVVRATVYARGFFCVGLIVLILITELPLTALLIPAFELGLAAWTWREDYTISIQR